MDSTLLIDKYSFHRIYGDSLFSKDRGALNRTIKENMVNLPDSFSVDDMAILLRNNVSYITEHDLRIYDLNIIKKVKSFIENINLKTDKPVVLDSVEYTSEYGKYSDNALLNPNKYRDGQMVICENGSAHVSIYDNELCYSISGGAFPVIDGEKLKYKGEKLRKFWTWGSCGACGNGGIYFDVLVKNWIYS